MIGAAVNRRAETSRSKPAAVFHAAALGIDHPNSRSSLGAGLCDRGASAEVFERFGPSDARKSAGLLAFGDLTFSAIIATLDMVNWRDRIVSDPRILKGKPCIRGTRIPAALVLGYLAAGKAAAVIVAEFPDLTADDIQACLSFARDLASFEDAAA